MQKLLDVSILNLEKLTREELTDIIASSTGSFVPYRNSPQETTAGLFDKIFLEADFTPSKSAEMLGFKLDSRPIAYLLFTSDVRSQSILVNFVYVDEAYREAGVATKLIKDSFKQLKNQGWHVIYARTWSSNAICKELYKKAGLKRERSTQARNRVNGDRTIWYFI